MKKRSDIDQAREQIARHLGQQRMKQALRKIEEAQNLLDSGLSDLSTLLGGCKTWQRGGRVSDQIRAYWYVVHALEQRLQAKGGPAVDDLHVDAELKRRGASAVGEQHG